MKQIFLEKGAIAIKEVCEPALSEYAVLVAVHYSYISAGTESATIAASGSLYSSLFSDIPGKVSKVLAMIKAQGIKGTRAIVESKLAGEISPIGYSCAGQVIAVGSKVTTIRVGDFVACAGSTASHAEIVLVPEQLVVRLPNQELLKSASITTLGAIALQGVRRAESKLGETVCVLGLGLLGQLTVQLLKVAGCRVIGIDILDDRLALAKELGASVVLNGAKQDVVKEILYLTDHYGVDATLITAASSSDALVQQAMHVTRKKGKVVIVGDVGLKLERAPFYQKEIDFLISCSYGPGRYDASYEQFGTDYPYAYVRWTERRNMEAIVSLLANGQLNIQPFTTEVSVEGAVQGYEQIKQRKALGVIVRYQEGLRPSPGRDASLHPGEMHAPRAKADKLRIGFIGAGGFARGKLMPTFASMKNELEITAITDPNIASAINCSRQYGAQHAFADDAELYQQDIADMVVIASPHKFHADQALRALEHGKAVFLEKPLCTDYEQLARIREYLYTHPHAQLTVDFNRPFSPFMQKIKQAIAQRNSPLIISYRMNEAYLPKDHWVQTELGGGQIIGQVCHLFDLMYDLTGAQPVGVSVDTISPRSANQLTTDNFSATITFDDGSLCVVLMTACGNKALGKERMELNFDGKTIVMDDFLSLTGHGLPSGFNSTVRGMDKGHEALIEKFVTAVRTGDKMPISFARLLAVSELTLKIDEMARSGVAKEHQKFMDINREEKIVAL